MNSQLERWTGYFGNEYTRRSLLTPGMLFDRAMTFKALFTQMRGDPTSVLEVGCNIGGNLLSMKPLVNPPAVLVGVEPCERARRIGQLNGLTIYPDCGQDLNFLDDFFDLVFTCGVLIHCELEAAREIVCEMNRVSKRLLMFMEYYGERDEEMAYRDEKKLLWKRPWDKHFKEWGLGDPISFGLLKKDSGFDDVTFWLFNKQRGEI